MVVLIMLSDYIQILDIINKFPSKFIFCHVECDRLSPGLNVHGNDNIMEYKGSGCFFTFSFY